MDRSTRRSLTFYLLILELVIFLIFLLFLVPFTFVGYFFPDYVPVPSALSTLNILIQADGIIMGLSGVIFAQLFSSAMDQQNVVYQKILDKPDTVSSYTKILNSFNSKKAQIGALATLTFAFFLLSIFTSITKMSSLGANTKVTDTIASFSTFYVPMASMMLGAFLLAISFLIFTLSLKPSLEFEEPKKGFFDYYK